MQRLLICLAVGTGLLLTAVSAPPAFAHKRHMHWHHHHHKGCWWLNGHRHCRWYL